MDKQKTRKLNLSIEKSLRTFKLRVQETIPCEGITTLLGPSGSGKSTLLYCLAGITSYTGSWHLEGLEHEPKVNLVFQNYELFPHLNVYENIRYGLRWQKISETQRKEKINFWLQELHLKTLIKAKIRELSGGERQRVALAQSLILDPDLLLLDEPTSSLDKPLKYAFMELVKELQAKRQFSVLWVTHDFNEALSFSDYAFFISEGRIIDQGPPLKLYEKPKNFYVANFTGILNLIDRKKALYCRPNHVQVKSHGPGIKAYLKLIQRKRLYLLGLFEYEQTRIYALLTQELLVGSYYYLSWSEDALITFVQ